jgi:hypothetical protein
LRKNCNHQQIIFYRNKSLDYFEPLNLQKVKDNRPGKTESQTFVKFTSHASCGQMHMNDFVFYLKMGWEHIISRTALDHIFFIAALAAIYMLRDWRQVLVLVTAFTIGHAITLVLSAKNIINVNPALVEFLIPCTIVFTALSNLFLKTFTPRSIRINYFLALFFGLIHGLAFAQNLKWIIAEDQSFVVAWLGFSVGLELGQVLVVLVILLLAQLAVGMLHLKRYHWVATVSVVVFSLAMQMAIERWPWKGKKVRPMALNSKMLINENVTNIVNSINMRNPINTFNLINSFNIINPLNSITQ